MCHLCDCLQALPLLGLWTPVHEDLPWHSTLAHLLGVAFPEAAHRLRVEGSISFLTDVRLASVNGWLMIAQKNA